MTVERLDKTSREDLGAFVRLLERSRDVGDSWRSVSNVLRKLVTNKVAIAPELFETREVGSELQVRLTKRGYEVARFLP